MDFTHDTTAVLPLALIGQREVHVLGPGDGHENFGEEGLAEIVSD